MKGVKEAVCGMRCIDLNNDPLKILRTRFSYSKNKIGGKNIRM